MNRPPYTFKPTPPTMYGPESGAVIADNRPNNYTLQGSAILSGTQGADQTKGISDPNTSMNASPVSAFGMTQPLIQHSLMTPDNTTVPNLRSAAPVYSGQGMHAMPTGKKYAFPVPGQVLQYNQLPRLGDSVMPRAAPQLQASFPSNLPGLPSQVMLATNGLSATVSGDGMNRNSSLPPGSFQVNGPRMPVPVGTLPGLSPRIPVPGSTVTQPAYVDTSINEPSRSAVPDGQQPGGFVSGSIMPAQGHFHTSMQYRGAIPPGPPPHGIMSGSTTPGDMSQMPQMTGTSLRGPLYQLSSPGTPLQAIRNPGPPPPMGNQVRAAMALPPNMSPGSVLGPPPIGPPPLHDTIRRDTGHFMPPPLATAVRGSHPKGASEFQPSMPSSLGNSVSGSTPDSQSQHSSRTGSPTNQLSYDDMEGQFISPPTSGVSPYSSTTSAGQRPMLPPTNFSGAPPHGGPKPVGGPRPVGGPVPGQPVHSFQSPPHNPQIHGFPSNNYAGSLNSSLNRLHLQPDHSMPLNLLQERHILPSARVELAEVNLPGDLKKANCCSDIMACTMNAMPNKQALLNKLRLPLGILIHPFKDLSQLPVIQSSVIVRCRSCRTYINPFITFIDARRWKCNLCFRNNELPDDFSYDPVSKTYGDPQRRPEIKSATIEFVAPSEYMLRPPQPAVYLYLLDVSFNAIETGYLQVFCQTLIEELDRIPGDSRLQIGFVTYDSSLHFYNLAAELTQPHMLVAPDLEEVELPSPDSLLVNLEESRCLVIDLLNKLPQWFEKNLDTGSALGPALLAAFKMMSPTGGRVTVVQTHLPTVGAGALKSREDPKEQAGKNSQSLGPVTDFYKKLALDCSAQQIAVDLFMLNSQYADIATLAGAAKHSGGCLYFFPGFHSIKNPSETERFESTLRRYFTRKIGFEAVMRIRCTRGISIHTFHGNFFVRSTDLLSLPNVNPEAGYGVQMSIDEELETNFVSFQAALLYTSSKGERRIRVHTLCLPVSSSFSEIHTSANQLVIIGLLAKMAVDKSLSASLGDAREAMINAAVDMLSAYGSCLSAGQRLGQLPCLYQLRLMPLYVLAMLKSSAFRTGTSTKLDDRVFAMEQCKNLPLRFLLQMIHPDLYPVHSLDEKNAVCKDDRVIAQPPLLPLSSAHIDRHGAYLMDTGSQMYLWLGAAISDQFCQDVIGVPNFQAVTDGKMDISELDNPTSQTLHQFVQHLNDQKPFAAPLTVVREDSRSRSIFLQYLIEDRTESTLSYLEFLQHLQKEIKS